MKMTKNIILGLLTMVMVVGNNLMINVANAYPTTFVYQAEDTTREVGFVRYYGGPEMETVVQANTASYNPGYLVSGPEKTDQLPGKRYQAIFRMRVLANTSLPVARLELNNVGNELLADRDLYVSDFAGMGTMTNLNMDFIATNIGTMEYKVWFYDNADVEIDKIEINELAASDNVTYESELLRRNVGSKVDDPAASSGKAVTTNTTGYVQYGPYTADQEPNNTYRATFRIKVTDNTSPATVLRIDASNSHGNGIWIYQDLKGTSFPTANEYHAFSIDFARINEGTMEYRVYSYGLTDVYIDYVKVEKITQTLGVYESENLYSAIGTIVSDTSASNGLARQALSSDIGYLQYGPYSVEQASGNTYRAMFRMQINNNTPSTKIARIEVYNHGGSGTWNYRDIYANEFVGLNNWQNFNVDFTRSNDGSIEYRVYSFGNGSGINIKCDKVDVFKIQQDQNNWLYESEYSQGIVGNQVLDLNASNQMAREATVTSNPAGHLVYGPYTDNQPIDNLYTAIFRLKTRNNLIGDNVVRIDVNNPGGTSKYVYRDIKGTEFTASNQWQDFEINFARLSGGSMEFRVYFYDKADILSDYVMVIPNTQSEFVYQAENMYTGPASATVNDTAADGGKAVKASKITALGQVTIGASYCPRPIGYIYKIGDNFCEYLTDHVVVYGPYTVDQAPGNYEVTFRLKRGTTGSGETLAKVDIFNNGGDGEYVYQDLNQTNLQTEYTDVTLHYYRTGLGTMEYRIFYNNVTDITIDKITVKKI